MLLVVLLWKSEVLWMCYASGMEVLCMSGQVHFRREANCVPSRPERNVANALVMSKNYGTAIAPIPRTTSVRNLSSVVLLRALSGSLEAATS
jgi:hypothetical protein